MLFSLADQYNSQAVCDDFKNSSIFGPKCTRQNIVKTVGQILVPIITVTATFKYWESLNLKI